MRYALCALCAAAGLLVGLALHRAPAPPLAAAAAPPPAREPERCVRALPDGGVPLELHVELRREDPAVCWRTVNLVSGNASAGAYCARLPDIMDALATSSPAPVLRAEVRQPPGGGHL